MLTNALYLVDSSAIVRLGEPEVAAVLEPLVARGLVATCGVVDLELFGRVADADDRAQIAATRAAAFHWLPTTDDDLRRALEVQALVAAGHTPQRAGWPPLVVAAVAERHGHVVLHSSPDFDGITKVTGQTVEWVGKAGSGK
jgi:predicted nucleic acid-binding protein